MVNFWNIFGLLCSVVVLAAIVYSVDYFGKKNAKEEDEIANES